MCINVRAMCIYGERDLHFGRLFFVNADLHFRPNPGVQLRSAPDTQFGSAGRAVDVQFSSTGCA